METRMNFNVIQGEKHIIKAWTKGVDLDEKLVFRKGRKI